MRKSQLRMCLEAMRMMLTGMPDKEEICRETGMSELSFKVMMQELEAAGINVRNTMGRLSMTGRELLSKGGDRHTTEAERTLADTMDVMVRSSHRWMMTTKRGETQAEPYCFDADFLWYYDVGRGRCARMPIASVVRVRKLPDIKTCQDGWSFPVYDPYSDGSPYGEAIGFSFRMTEPCAIEFIRSFPGASSFVTDTGEGDYPYLLQSEAHDLEAVACFVALRGHMVSQVKPALLRAMAIGRARTAYDNIRNIT